MAKAVKTIEAMELNKRNKLEIKTFTKGMSCPADAKDWNAHKKAGSIQSTTLGQGGGGHAVGTGACVQNMSEMLYSAKGLASTPSQLLA